MGKIQRILRALPIAAAGFLGGLAVRDGPALAVGGVKSGDINGDGNVDVSDAVSLINWLFLAGPEPVPIQCPDSPPSLPATGQTSCSDAGGAPAECAGPECPGQDGSYRSGCPAEGRFSDNGDGTVTDRCTGLTWQKESSAEKYGWCEALGYCEGLEQSGHADWRLPNARELLSIVDYGRPELAIDPVLSSTPAGHWCSTTQVGFSDSAWCVVFGFGTSEFVGKDTRLNVRAVRGGI